MKSLFASLALAGFTATSAFAQEPPAAQPWVTTRDREGDTLMATASFSNGITLVSRCSYRTLELILAGLPSADESASQTRMLTVMIDEDVASQPVAWTIASDPTAAFSRLPGPMTRRLMEGGHLQVIIPAPPGGRRTRYVMELSRSEEAVRQVLEHCGKPLEDENDARILGDAGSGLPGPLVWVQRPAPDFPGATVHGQSMWGNATLSCEVRTDGRLTDCDIESEFPRSGGFGLAAKRAALQSRVGLSEAAVAEGRTIEPDKRIVFSVNFRMAD